MLNSCEHDYEQPQLTVSELARVFGLSAQAVRFYHKKGLLLPDARGENSYRRYSWNKLSVLAQICFFRRAGFSIEDIRAYMQLGSLQEASDYMQTFIKKLKNDALEIQRAIDILERKCGYLNKFSAQASPDTAQILTLPPRRYIHLGEDELSSANNDFFFDYPLIAVYQVNENDAIRKIEIGAYLDPDMPPVTGADVRELPAQRCIVCNFKGSYDAVYEKIAALYQAFSQENLSHTAYAVNLIDHVIENNQNNYIVNIQIPLEPPFS